MTPPSCVIFDLDGTLIDSAVVCTGILNDMLRDRGSTRVIRASDAHPYMSLGGGELVASMLGNDCGDPDVELMEFRSRYAARPTPADSLFEGVRDGLEVLATSGIALAVCSNKPQHLCEKVISELGLAHAFPVVVGGGPDRRPKPAPDMLEMTLRSLGASRDDAILVGDSKVDHGAAVACGVAFRFVTYGYAGGWSAPGITKFDKFADLVGTIAAGSYAAAPLRQAACAR